MTAKRLPLPLTKRCAMCKLTRADGVIIKMGQGYCTDCRRLYQERAKQAALEKASHAEIKPKTRTPTES